MPETDTPFHTLAIVHLNFIPTQDKQLFQHKAGMLKPKQVAQEITGEKNQVITSLFQPKKVSG